MSFLSIISPYSNLILKDLLNTDLSMANGYVGIFSIPLGFICFYYYRKEKNLFRYVIFFISFFLISLGGYGGIKTILYYILPPIRYMQYNSPFRYVWIFMICLGAGVGFTIMEEKRNVLIKYFKPFFCWFLVILLSSGILVFLLLTSNLLIPRHLHLLFAPSLVLFPGLLITLFVFRNRMDTKTTLVMNIFLGLVIIDSAFHFYSNRRTVYQKRNLTYDEKSPHIKNTALDRGPDKRIPQYTVREYNRQYLTKEFLIFSYTTLTESIYRKLTYESRFRSVMELPDFYWLTPGVEKMQESDKNRVISILASKGKDDNIPVFVADDLPLAGKPVKFGTYGGITVLHYSPEYIRIKVSVPDREGAFLASTERYTKDWEAYMDGKEIRVFRHNVYFRGLAIPGGDHIIEWKYNPGYWLPLVVLSYSCITVFIIAAIIFIRKKI